MSKTMQILLAIAGALLLIAVVLTMFGKPPNLPLGPLQGIFAKEEQPVTPVTTPTTDPGAGTGTDECASTLPGTGTDPGAATTETTPAATDPTTGATTPGATTPTATTPGIDCPPATNTEPDTTTPADPGTGATAPGTRATSTTDGTNNGNSPEALRAAKDATGVMAKAKIQVATTATLTPSVGGVSVQGALRKYRTTVTAAVLVMRLDDAAQQQWADAGASVQKTLVTSFLTRLGKTYRRSARSITVVDPSGNILAIGDAAPRGTATVKLF